MRFLEGNQIFRLKINAINVKKDYWGKTYIIEPMIATYTLP